MAPSIANTDCYRPPFTLCVSAQVTPYAVFPYENVRGAQWISDLTAWVVRNENLYSPYNGSIHNRKKET